MKPFVRWSALSKGFSRRLCSSSGTPSSPEKKFRGGIPVRRRNIPDEAASDIPLVDHPAPPRPPSYIPPEERDPSDESLAFLKEGSPLQHLRQDETMLESGQEWAPSLKERKIPLPRYADEKAEQLKSTSVHAGRSLLDKGKVVDTGEYYFHNNINNESFPTEESLDEGPSSRLKQLNGGKPKLGHRTRGNEKAERKGEEEDASSGTVFEDFKQKDEEDNRPKKPKLSPSQQMSIDLKKLEYYEGSPQYPQMMKEFMEKYGNNPTAERDEGKAYSTHEVDQGLAEQPLDYLRGSPKLQAHLTSGMRQFDPITVMQQHGVMRFQGYAFPPSTELGKLKNVDEVKAVVDSHRDNKAVAALRRGFNALTGRTSDKTDYLATGDKPAEDNHILYRTLGLDAVQRRQMRFMLTDFDHGDRQTAFHVMMSYPYTDWIHVIYMFLVGIALYELQLRYGAYEFYDEYMGLDLRQVPGMKKPFLAVITAGIMLFLLFQPLLVASIATTRAYRIIMKRPIGPP